MQEKLYESLPDVGAYLERIGIAERKEPTLSFLNELIYAHQCHVPFEDLDVHEKALEPSLGKADLFEKIVVRRRGGYCFELNGLFYSLLKALGYEVRAAMARVLTRPVPYPMLSHRANVVTFEDGDYLVDVGFGGPMPAFALKLEDGLSQTAHGQTFAPHIHDEYWWNIGYSGSSEEERLVMRMCVMPAEEHDFVPLSFYQSQNPQSVFRNVRMANVKTDDGAHDIRDMTYTRFKDGTRTVREIESDEELEALLSECFGIVDWR